ncbi:MAG: hypothetical protein GPJ54_07375 [Candidatus Heimdallarchaeota archaeon]|nr:hypothetical protein [Candidatus Heimdallarchaeota archaeon]
MGISPRELIITTTHKASEESRSFSKFLEHVIPFSTYIPRGSKNIDEILMVALETRAEYVIICHSKGNKVTEIKFYTIVKNQLKLLERSMRIYEYIDYKIFGWKSMPEKGPLSVSREVRNNNPEIIDFFEKMFRIVVGSKTELWLLVDAVKNEGYLQFVDALTIKPFTHLRISIKSKSQSN